MKHASFWSRFKHAQDEKSAGQTRSGRDMLVAGGWILLVTYLSSRFDWADLWVEFSHRHDAWQLDELPVILAVGSLAVGWYACRRWLEAARSSRKLADARDALEATHHHLRISINSMRNGIAIWNAEDRLELANDGYRKFHGEKFEDRIVPGLAHEDLLRIRFDSNIWNVDQLDWRDWVRAETRHRRAAPDGERSLTLTDGRQIVESEQVLANHDVITTLIDVTAHRRRESELRDARVKLERIAYFDELTGLANRAHCQKDLAEKFAYADVDTSFALIQIDLDNFKRVNDTLGHAAGDHLLNALGIRLTLLNRAFKNFAPYRWGGDEFIAIVDRDENTDLNLICQELNDVVAIALEYEKNTIRPTVSLGVARYPEDATDLKALMIFADLALYKTKELGRDGYQFFTSEMRDKIEAESRIEEELRVAIATGQLQLYFQPQINIRDESITGLEALLRWNHPTRGVIGPKEFLSVVETSGLAPAVGCRVFDEAMKAAKRWVDDGVDFGRLAVNLSPEHLKKDCVLEDFFGAMTKYGVEPRHLAVEFLESVFLDDPTADVGDVLTQLRARGVHVELDDFGTGYASLSHLSTMPINGLKIDRSFVRNMSNDLKQQGIVSSLVTMSKLMGLHVVCEGVETRQQVDAIEGFGNCSIQGYFVAKPMDFEEMTDWIRNERNLGVLQFLPDIAVGGN